MRRLMLLRHAKSDWTGAASDHERVLAERGRLAAPIIGRYLAAEGLIPDLVLVSDSERTMETWELVAAHLPAELKVEYEPRLYEAPPSAVGRVLRGLGKGPRTVLVVGHNPGMAGTALALVGHGDRYALARMQQKFPTCGLAVLDLDGDDWNELAEASARLDRFVTPKSLDASQEDD
jgi:phosphohistidine phosphatase